MFGQLISAEYADVNSGWMYLLYVFVLLFVVVQSIFYLVKSIRRAKKINMDMGKVKKVITSSIMFSILPAVGIFIGVVLLAGAIGIPLPAIRLSIVGSLQYETLAADMVAEQVGNGLASISFSEIPKDVFVTFVLAMTFGIIWGPLFVLFFYKKLQPKMLGAVKKNNDFAPYIFAACFIGMVLAYLSVALAEPFYLISGKEYKNGAGEAFFPLIAIVVSALAMWFFDFLIRKKNQKWLESFSLAFSMLIGMSAVAAVNAIILAV